MSDKHVRRSGEDYAAALISLLPVGQAWPRNSESTLIRTMTGLALYWGTVDARAADLLETESDPRYTDVLLPDWERAFGLPDPCLAEPLTKPQRRKMLVQRITMLGGQSRAFFYGVAESLDQKIQIREYAPFMTGVSRCGMTLDDTGLFPRWQLGPPELRFYWTVHVLEPRLTWFRVGAGECGVDPHLRIGLSTDLECLFNRWKPAHTQIIFDYSGLAPGDPMAGTP